MQLYAYQTDRQGKIELIFGMNVSAYSVPISQRSRAVKAWLDAWEVCSGHLLNNANPVVASTDCCFEQPARDAKYRMDVSIERFSIIAESCVDRLNEIIW